MLKKVVWLFVPALLLAGCGPNKAELEQQEKQKKAAEINVQLALAYYQRGNLEMAVDKSKRALAQNPELPSAHHASALINEALGYFEVAEKEYQATIKLNPRDSEAHNNYGNMLCRQGHYEKAKQEFMAALANPLYKTPELALTNGALCARQHKDNETAAQWLKQSLEKSPQYPLPLYYLAEMEFEQGHYPIARAYIERYHKQAQKSAASLWLGIRIADALGNAGDVASLGLYLEGQFGQSPEAEQYRQLKNKKK